MTTAVATTPTQTPGDAPRRRMDPMRKVALAGGIAYLVTFAASIPQLALFADIEPRAVIVNRDVPDVYLVPSALQGEGLDTLVVEKLGLPAGGADLGEWNDLTERIKRLGKPVEIGRAAGKERV